VLHVGSLELKLHRKSSKCLSEKRGTGRLIRIWEELTKNDMLITMQQKSMILDRIE
jgi:hypothetical protein